MQSKSNITVLLVDDEADIIDFLKYNIQKEGYQVYTAKNGQEAVDMLARVRPNLILLDLMMPVMDGIETCHIIRKQNNIAQPIIAFLTSRGEDYSQVAGFEAGADDYITKPIRPRLLLSKIEALLRRLHYGQENTVVAPNAAIQINREKFVVYIKGEPLILPKKEFELLEYLMTKPGKVFQREEILTHVWGNETIVGMRTIDVHVRKLREKLGDDYIRTIKGVGYTFVPGEK